MYIHRNIDKELEEWRQSNKRKPLLIRGARQVGKTKSIRELGKSFKHYLEINFEEESKIRLIFEETITPQELIKIFSAYYNTPIETGKTLLFFDEIQACIPAIRSLRFFAEKMPNLHVIAAGSLLEFALQEIPSFGVGRIRSIFMYPLCFDEFLIALGQVKLINLRDKADFENPLPDVIHQKLIGHFREFLILGGMPEVVSSYIETQNYTTCMKILDDLITSMQDDFSKYKKRVPSSRVRDVFESVTNQAGGKFVYSKVLSSSNHKQIKEALSLLQLAGIVIPVVHSSANGVPLGAEANPKKQKMLLFDTGIFLRILDLKYSEMLFSKEFSIINKGGITEQYVGLELLKANNVLRKKNLYYWHRESRNSNAEVDYLLVLDQVIYPIEVKSGTKGSMRSIYQFLKEKKSKTGIRTSLENYDSFEEIRVLPLYAISTLQYIQSL